jgi:hypothetical protein
VISNKSKKTHRERKFRDARMAFDVENVIDLREKNADGQAK